MDNPFYGIHFDSASGSRPNGCNDQDDSAVGERGTADTRGPNADQPACLYISTDCEVSGPSHNRRAGSDTYGSLLPRVKRSAEDLDLKNQRHVLEDFCVARGLANVEFIEEIGGGLNFKRKKFESVMDDIGMRQIKTLVIAHRDRLTRFGFEWFERYAKQHGCEVLVLNQERLSPEQEMVQDLMTIVHCFSSRLYGLRNYRKKLNEALRKDIRHEQA